MSSASEKTEKATILPFKRYVDSVDDTTRKSMMMAQIQIETGKHPTSIDRYLYGAVRPDEQNRRAIAFVVNKIVKPAPKVKGDDLFPEDFPYTGANKKKSAGNDNA